MIGKKAFYSILQKTLFTFHSVFNFYIAKKMMNQMSQLSKFNICFSYHSLSTDALYSDHWNFYKFRGQKQGDQRSEDSEDEKQHKRRKEEDSVLKYGDVIVLNIPTHSNSTYRQISLKSVISDTLHAWELGDYGFKPLSRFTILPSTEYLKLHDLIDHNDIQYDTQDNYFKYDEFLQEGQYNVKYQKYKFGKPVKYGDTIQLYHGVSPYSLTSSKF